jgi:tRNA threonylcarbamoyladenosine biosynthesis protein TsaB
MELLIDTSTRYASVAVSINGVVSRELLWRSDRNHSVELVPAINELLKMQRVSIRDIQHVIVCSGPGAFSALRVGVSTAKALAVGSNIGLVGVSTMLVEVHPYVNLGGKVTGFIPAGRGRAYVGTYENGSLDETGLRIQTCNEIIDSLMPDTIYCGEAVGMLVDEAGMDPKKFSCSFVSPPTRRPSVIASLGYELIESSAMHDPLVLEPLYVKSAQIDSANKKNISS